MSISRRSAIQLLAGTGVGLLLPQCATAAPLSATEATDETIPTPTPRVDRFEKLAYGMFMHWGLYSQLGRGEWVMNMEKIPREEYRKLKDTFTAKDFDGRAIARLAKKAGMKYVTLTTRHHEGFSLYDTRGLSDYDAPHSAAGRDLVANFVEGCRAEGIVPMFYHTTLDWYQESFLNDFNAYLDYLHASVEVLCRNYGDIGGFWFDGNWSRKNADWKLDRLYGIIRKYQPEAMIINNTGLHDRGKLEHPEIDGVTYERGRPGPLDRRGMGKYVTGEMCQTMNEHWGLGKNDFHYMSPKEIIVLLAACRRVGANMLLNVGPTAEGAIPPYEAAALERTGDWVRLFAEPFYNGKPLAVDCENADDFALKTDDATYLFIHNLSTRGDKNVTVPGNGAGPRTFTGLNNKITGAVWMDNNESLGFEQNSSAKKLTLKCTGYPYGTNTVVRVAKLT